MEFYIEGKKVQGIGYRAHLAMLALTSGVQRLYAENLPPEKERQQVVVYAGARSKKKIDLFYERVREKVPEGAIGVVVGEPKPYHSKVLVPPVMEYVSTLTAGELTKGISAIKGLGEAARQGFESLSSNLGNIDTDVKQGFEELPPKIAQSLVEALIRAGVIKK